MFFFDHLSVLSTYNNVSVNRLYEFSGFLRPSLNVLQFLPHLDSLQNDWMPYFPFNWVSDYFVCRKVFDLLYMFPRFSVSKVDSAVQCSAARNPDLEVAIAHARQVCSQHHSLTQCFPQCPSFAEQL